MATTTDRQQSQTFKKTRFALLLSSLLHEPLACLYIWLPFILRKDLQASALEISILATLKPLVSIISFYWIGIAQYFKLNLQKGFLVAGILARMPFLFFPIYPSVGYSIFAATVYMLFTRASVPSWMEMLKMNLSTNERGKWFSLGSMIGYAEGVILAVALGSLFDVYLTSWRYLFALSALIGIVGVIVQGNIPMKVIKLEEACQVSLKTLIVKPWKDTISIMKKRPDFALFQWGFMAAGLGIMLANVICPLYFVDYLYLRHVDYANARYVFMGLGFIFFSPIWQNYMKRYSLFLLTLFIDMGFVLFCFALILAQMNGQFLYIAFLLYGISQAGSHLVWHLSGPIFAGDEESSKYSGINVVMVGIRGLIGPGVGSLLYVLYGPTVVFSCSLVLCLIGGLLMLKQRKGFTLKIIGSMS
jgi:MFS family permease